MGLKKEIEKVKDKLKIISISTNVFDSIGVI